VAHTCNPRYSGGRDQDDRGSKPAQANSSRDSISKKTLTKRAYGVAQGEGPRVKPQYSKKKKRKKATADLVDSFIASENYFPFSLYHS
jgi:hypothetical protein